MNLTKIKFVELHLWAFLLASGLSERRRAVLSDIKDDFEDETFTLFCDERSTRKHRLRSASEVRREENKIFTCNFSRDCRKCAKRNESGERWCHCCVKQVFIRWRLAPKLWLKFPISNFSPRKCQQEVKSQFYCVDKAAATRHKSIRIVIYARASVDATFTWGKSLSAEKSLNLSSVGKRSTWFIRSTSLSFLMRPIEACLFLDRHQHRRVAKQNHMTDKLKIETRDSGKSSIVTSRVAPKSLSAISVREISPRSMPVNNCAN